MFLILTKDGKEDSFGLRLEVEHCGECPEIVDIRTYPDYPDEANCCIPREFMRIPLNNLIGQLRKAMVERVQRVCFVYMPMHNGTAC